MKKILFIIVAVILISGLIFTGCGSSTTPATTATTATTTTSTTPSITPKYGGTLKIADPIAPRTSIGWIPDPNAFAAGICGPIFMDTLLKADNKGAIKPNLASKYEVSTDLKTITLTLRQGVKFHDNSDFNATVLKWNLDLLVAAKMGDYANVSSIDIIDPYTIKLNVAKYTNTLLLNLGSTNIVSKAAFDAHGGGDAAIEWMRFNPVGTGPFKFVSYTPNVVIKGVKFADYWQKGKPYLDAVEMYYITDPMTKAASFQAGEMDVIGGDLSKVEYDLQQKGFNIVLDYIGIYTIVPDSKNSASPFANLKVRQAVDYAIDRDAIVKSLSFGYWKATPEFAIPGSASYDDSITARAYNPDKARQLLTEAGYPTGFKTQITASSALSNRDAVVAIQGYLGKVGIEMTVNMIDHAAYTQLIRKGWDAGFAGVAKALDANMNYAINLHWTQNSLDHPSMLKPDEFQQLYVAAVGAKDFDPVLTKKAVRYLYDNALIIPIYATARGQVMQPYVRDLGMYTMHNWPSWEPANAWLNK